MSLKNVIKFSRIEASPMHLHAGIFTDGMYIPDEDIILYRETVGSFGLPHYGVSDSKSILDELEKILGGTVQEEDGCYVVQERKEGKYPHLSTPRVTYRDVLEIKIDASYLESLIHDAWENETLNKSVKSRISRYLDE